MRFVLMLLLIALWVVWNVFLPEEFGHLGLQQFQDDVLVPKELRGIDLLSWVLDFALLGSVVYWVIGLIKKVVSK